MIGASLYESVQTNSPAIGILVCGPNNGTGGVTGPQADFLSYMHLPPAIAQLFGMCDTSEPRN